MHDNERPKSFNKGAESAGGGVEVRDGRGDEALEESTGGVSGAGDSLGTAGGLSRL